MTNIIHQYIQLWTSISIVLSFLHFFSVTGSPTTPVEIVQLNPLRQSQEPPQSPGTLEDGGDESLIMLMETKPQSRNTFHILTECMTVSMDEGIFHYKSHGSPTPCGLYLLSDPDKVIRITIDYLNVDCTKGGLLSFVDGWELNGEVFPSILDHPKDIGARFNEFCGHGRSTRRSYLSSQNAALLQYRIPVFAQGFSVRIQHLSNPRPCNVLVQDIEGIYTIENYGRRVNCSITTLFDAKIRLLYLSTGIEPIGFISASSSTGILHKCTKRGFGDYVEIGGSAGLDTSRMTIIEELCGQDHKLLSKDEYFRIFCGLTTIRLISSGDWENKIVIEVHRAVSDDLDLANYICEEI